MKITAIATVAAVGVFALACNFNNTSHNYTGDWPAPVDFNDVAIVPDIASEWAGDQKEEIVTAVLNEVEDGIDEAWVAVTESDPQVVNVSENTTLSFGPPTGYVGLDGAVFTVPVISASKVNVDKPIIGGDYVITTPLIITVDTETDNVIGWTLDPDGISIRKRD